MSRSFEERILWYFYKRASSSMLFLLTLASAFISVGYFKEDGRIFIFLGFFLMAIAGWQLLRTLFCEVKGSEVDSSAMKFVDNANIEQDFNKAFSFDAEDDETIEKVILHGYCAYSIDTEPLYRWDETDKKARASNYQVTCFGIDKDVLFTYSETKSLVDAEYNEKSSMFTISSIEEVEINKVRRSCAISAAKNSDTVLEDFDVLIFYKSNGETYAFSFDSSQMKTAEYIRDFITKRQTNLNKLRMPGKKSSAEKRGSVDFSKLGKKQIEALNIGIIGDEMSPIGLSEGQNFDANLNR